MTSSIETINKRISVRSYSGDPIPEAELGKLKVFMATLDRGPFGSPVRFSFLDESSLDKASLKKLGTYGMITGGRYYVAGAVGKGEYAEMDYGYCLELIILKATELGLGTCWLGGSLNRSSFAEKIGLLETEILPAITPVGIAADHTRLKTVFIQNLMQVRKRKEFGSIFFDGSEGVPLDKEKLGPWAAVFEAVRTGPSASNKQPWRIVRDGDNFDFYLDYNVLYNSIFREFAIQKLDIGIACCHFESAAKELKLPGRWKKITPSPAAGKLLYCMTWDGSGD